MTIWWVRPPEGAGPLCFIKSKVRTVISELKVLFILIFDKRNWICFYLSVCSLFGCALSLFLQAAAAHPTSLGKPIYGNQLSQTDAGSFSYRLVIRPQSLHVQLLWFPVLTSCFFYRKLFVGLLTSELWFVASSVGLDLIWRTFIWNHLMLHGWPGPNLPVCLLPAWPSHFAMNPLTVNLLKERERLGTTQLVFNQVPASLSLWWIHPDDSYD